MIINGTIDNNIIDGTSQSDLISSLAGDDEVRAGNGKDIIDAGDNDDHAYGGNGNDTIGGGTGFDVLFGGNGDDTLNGGLHGDTLFGGNGNDTLNGGDQADFGTDFLYGGNGNDVAVIVGAAFSHGADVYDGGNGQDTFRLELTGAEWARGDVRSGAVRFQHAIDGGNRTPFEYDAFNMTARGFERLDVLVDGVKVDPHGLPLQALDDHYSTFDNVLFSGNVLDNDILPFPAAHVSVLSEPHWGTLDLRDDGSFTYSPNSNPEVGGFSDYAYYQVEDVHGDISTASMSFNVVYVYDPPTAGPDFGTVSEDGPSIVIDITGNDFLSSFGGTALYHFQNFSGPNGAATDNGDGTITYSPNGAFEALNEGETATVMLSYLFVDSVAGAASGLITVTIEGHDEPGAALGSAVISAASEIALVEPLILKGGNPDDTLIGGGGDDTISGGNGADMLNGGAGDDTMNGGTGRDILEGGIGDDLMNGGVGGDIFRFKPGFGHDMITGFRATGADHDVLEFDAAIFADADALFAHCTDTGDGVLIMGDAGNTLLIKDASLAGLQAHPEDFHFV